MQFQIVINIFICYQKKINEFFFAVTKLVEVSVSKVSLITSKENA